MSSPTVRRRQPECLTALRTASRRIRYSCPRWWSESRDSTTGGGELRANVVRHGHLQQIVQGRYEAVLRLGVPELHREVPGLLQRGLHHLLRRVQLAVGPHRIFPRQRLVELEAQ